MTEVFNANDTIRPVTGLVDGTTYYGKVYTSGTLCVHEAANAPTDKNVASFRYFGGEDFRFQKTSGENIYVWILEDDGSGSLVFNQAV